MWVLERKPCHLPSFDLEIAADGLHGDFSDCQLSGGDVRKSIMGSGID